MKTSSLSEKEKLFCLYYSSAWNLKEAALKAGYKLLPERMGIRLLQRPQVLDEISRIRSKLQVDSTNVKSGYERLAFGSICDAIKLLFCSDYQDIDFELLDLFNVSEIKKLKDGAMEIKFFDRFKALDRLSDLSKQQLSKIPPLYKAIINSTNALSDGEVIEI